MRRYLKAPPSAAETRDVPARLGLEPWDTTDDGQAVVARTEEAVRSALT